MLSSMKISLFSLALIASLAGLTGAQPQFAGDLNDDHRVDFEDLRIFSQQWLAPPGCSGHPDDCADLDPTNGNGVDMVDFAVLAQNWRQGPKVVINEIHYDPDVKTELVEFVELYNTGTTDANLSGWYFSDGICYEFPPGSTLPVGNYIIVVQDPCAIWTKFGTPLNLIFGPYEGRLENDGEKLELRNAEGVKIDEVDYRRCFPWPIVGDPPGYSIELVNPTLDNNLGGSWRPSVPQVEDIELISDGAEWRYFKGTQEPSTPMDAWREFGFNDDPGSTNWLEGYTAIGYGESFIVTLLGDMRGGYTTVYLRKIFNVIKLDDIEMLVLEAKYDDGINVWINDAHVAQSPNVSSEDLPFDATASSRESHNFDPFPLPDPSGYLDSGDNIIAIQLLNSSLSSSSDCFIDVRLKNIAPAGGPTPGRQNTTYTTNIPPHMRQVKHHPKQPRSSEDVKITVKVTDPDGVQSVILSYQLVYPGSYIELGDPEYEINWTDANSPMTDDGTEGDEEADDDIYTVVLPGSLHTHRLLVRYRITATDNTGLGITGPYSHDPQPNFAYFVYDGVPGWSGAIDPDSSDPVLNQVVYYDPAVLTKVPVYHLISKKDSVEHAQWIDKYMGDLYKWSGTLVYDGDVYDHIHYRARGGVWRYAMGKNMWKFDFNRGHYFQASDDYGKKYKFTWDKLNFSACIQHGNYLHRGEQGMFEALAFKLFNLAGVPAPKTHYVQFRIIDDAAESGPTQYEGDFWGLYLVLEQMDGRFLDEHDLPDGNLYKMEDGTGPSGYGELNNQGTTAVTDSSDLIAFVNGYKTYPGESWWRANVTVDCYYSYRTIVDGIHHYDIGSGKNYFYYLNPETDMWSQLPWDVDLSWADSMYDCGNSGLSPFKRYGLLNQSGLNLEYKNGVREILDLLFNTDQCWQLIDDYAAIIDDPEGGLSIVDADRAMWDYNPIMTNTGYPHYVNLSKAGEGRFYQQAATKDFPGMVQIMKDYVVHRVTVGDPGNGQLPLDEIAYDAAIPYTPTVTATCGPNYPSNALTFETSPFSDPQGDGTFAAMKWRISEVTDAAAPAYNPSESRKYEIQAVWEKEITDFNSTITIPATVVKIGHAYRVRVRMKDNSGQWSHWSSPVQFIVGEPLSASSTP